MTGHTILDSATSLVAHGVPVLAVHGVIEAAHRKGLVCLCGSNLCDSPGKHPDVAIFPKERGAAKTTKGHYCTLDLDVVRTIFEDAKHLNLGAVTGDAVVVIDVDDPDDLVKLEAEHDKLPRTWRSRTARGEHHWFRPPPGVIIKNRKLAPKIDVRGHGGYVVAPGSRHISGVAYEWVEGHSPSDLPLADLPASLVAKLADTAKRKKPNGEAQETETEEQTEPVNPGRSRSYALVLLKNLCAELANTAGGGRNIKLNNSAMQLGHWVGGGVLEEDEVRKALAEAAAESGLGDKEIELTMASGLEAGQVEPTFDPPDNSMDSPPVLDADRVSAIFEEDAANKANGKSPGMSKLETSFYDAAAKKTPPDMGDSSGGFSPTDGGEDQPPSERRDLLAAAWRTLKLPPRDYLLGDVFCTTSRWIIIGPTGVGKTLFALDMAAAVAAGAPFLGWKGGRSACVIYLDGELPAETFKERMILATEPYKPTIRLYGYNRDVLDPKEMPPLNDAKGEGIRWLLREIDKLRPDAIFFDSVMCLLTGVMSEEESWAPMKALNPQLSARRIAQVWLHHTGHDQTKGFGTKTREWTLDTVLMLSEPEPGSGAIGIEFTKARLRTPETRDLFAPQLIRREPEGWVVAGDHTPGRAREESETAIIKRSILEAYDRLAVTAKTQGDFNGVSVRKVRVDDVRDEVKDKGYLDTKETGGLTSTARSNFSRAKASLISSRQLAEEDELIWRSPKQASKR